MTLAEVIPAARRLTAIEKLKLIQVLVEDLTWILLKILQLHIIIIKVKK